MILRLIYGCLFFLCCVIVQAQAPIQPKELPAKDYKEYKKAQKYSRETKFEKALEIYAKLIQKHPGLIDAYLNRSHIYYQSKELEKSISDLLRIIELKSKSPLIYSTLGQIYLDLERYQDASEAYKLCLEYLDNSDPRYAEIARKQRNAEFAHMAIANPVPYEPKSLNSSVNTPDSEYLPAFTADGTRMIYTRLIDSQEDFYYSDWVDGEFTDGVPMKALNTPFNEGAHTVSPDGNTIIFTVCDAYRTYGSCDLFITENVNNQWSRPKNMGKTINSINWESQPSLSFDGKTLYFSSKRTGGVGGSDIWYSLRGVDGSWSPPLLLEGGVNTPWDDESPFIHPDNRTLYFRSDGHPGMGGFDIFVARRASASEKFEDVQNIGYPINTKDSEGALFVTLDGHKAYFASDQGTELNGRRKNLDLFEFDLPVQSRPIEVAYLRTSIKDHHSGKSLAAQIKITDIVSANLVIDTLIEIDQKFWSTLPTGRKYHIEAIKEGYQYFAEHFDLDGSHSLHHPFEKDISLVPILETVVDSKPIVLNNIFFESGSSTLLDISAIEIQRLTAFLVENPKIRIRIIGHTDNVGSSADNLKLSTDRAEEVYQAIIAHGISPSRIEYKGMGENQPIDDNLTEAGRQNNRRTEFVIISL